MISSVSYSSLTDLPSLSTVKLGVSSNRSVSVYLFLSYNGNLSRIEKNVKKRQKKHKREENDLRTHIHIHVQVNNKRVWIIAIIISLSSFLFGYSMTALNVAITDDESSKGRLDDDIHLTTLMSEFATALTPIGALFGCIAGSSPADRFGRRLTVLFTSVLFIVGTLACGPPFINNIYFLFVGRFIVGFAVGMESSIVPMYLLEISPEEIRGSVGTLHQFAVTIGILVSSLVGAAFVSWVDHGWQIVLGLTAVPAIVQILCAPIIAESPRWLMLRGRKDDCVKALRMLHPDWSEDEVISESRIIEDEIANASKSIEIDSKVSWSDIFTRYQREVFVGLSVMSLTAVTGVNTVIFYSTNIFKLAGLDQSIIGTIVVTVTNVGATFLAVRLVDHVGRKKLLTTGMWIMILPLTVMAIVLLADIEETIQGCVAIACVVVFIVGFAVGLGAVSWVIVSEIVPARIRAKCNGLFVSMNWFINILISLFTLTSIESLGGGKSHDEKKRGVAILYGIFAVITAMGLVLVYTIVNESSPENKSNVGTKPLLKSNDDDDDVRKNEETTIDLFDNRHRRQSSDGEPLEF